MKTNKRCNAYCKDGSGKCSNSRSIGNYCLVHHFKAKENPEKWEKLQKRLKTQGK